ncbi:hypothetical protein FRC10_005880 [Ceratobasidium sp. 414]|nr:hypothetical protein FRC10_005880 [Ceratobasidium sp. 414]
MEQGNKSVKFCTKRKLDEEHTAWNKEQAAAFVKDVEEIQEAIKSCDAQAFADSLAESLDEASVHAVEVVKQLISPILLDEYKDAKHCVRCHLTYTEEDNHGSACVIRCAYELQPFVLRITPQQPYLMTQCCGRVFKHVTTWDYAKLVCVEERHTDNLDEVAFFDPSRGKSAVGSEPVPVERNNPLIITCEAKGCKKKTDVAQVHLKVTLKATTNMAEQNKKRKIDGEDRAPWSKATAAAFVKDVEALQEAIQYCDAFAFTETLSESLDQASMDTIQMVKELVTPILLDGNTDNRHCVRCHESYTEQDNHGTACIIQCSGKLHAFALKTTPKQSYYMAECCGRVFKVVDGWNYTNLVCIEERHTDDPDVVKYFDPNRGQKAEDVKSKDGKPKDAVPLESNNPNVLACAVKGCGKKT